MLLHMVVFGVILVSLFSASYAQIDSQVGDEIFVMVQTTIRDSDGSLVAYLESTRFTDINYQRLDGFLDRETSNRSDPVVDIDGTSYEIIIRKQTHVFDAVNTVSSTLILDNTDRTVLLARFAHDGYFVMPGDRLESVWTFIRPA